MADTPSTPMVTVSAFEWENLKREWENLKREETLRDLEARLSERFHRRFWVLLMVGMILSIGGVQTIAFLVISSRLMGGPAVQVAQAESPAMAQVQAALRRAEEQTARAAALGDKIDQLNSKIASLESDNATMRQRLERPVTAAREPERRPVSAPPPPPPAAREAPRTASLPSAPPPADGGYRMTSEYELRLVVFGKTEATKIPPIQDYFKKLGYKVVADAAPDPNSPYPTRQDFVFISYRKGSRPEAQKIEQFLRREFSIQTVLAQYDVGEKLAGDIQIAFQEQRSTRQQ